MDTSVSRSTDLLPIRPIGRKLSRYVRIERSDAVDASKPLTRKECLFIQYYRSGMKPTPAAREAGYSESSANQAAVFLLKNPKVAKEISRLDALDLEDIEVEDPKSILKKLYVLSTANLADYLEYEEDPATKKLEPKINLNNVSREQMYAIRAISYDDAGKVKNIELEPRMKGLETRLKALFAKKDIESGGTNRISFNDLDSLYKHVTNIQINIASKDQAYKVIESSSSLPIALGDPVTKNQLPAE